MIEVNNNIDLNIDENLEACHQLVKRRNIRHNNNSKSTTGSLKRKLASREQHIIDAKNKRYKKMN